MSQTESLPASLKSKVEQPLAQNRLELRYKQQDRTLRIILISVGTLSVILGVIGVFLPVLPTTPFLLLAASCYARSSEGFYNWLLNNKLCGDYIKNYRAGKGIPLKQKLLIILLLWLTIGATAGLAVSNWLIRGILLLIAVGVTIHLLKLKTYK